MFNQTTQSHNLEEVLDRQLIELAKPALEKGEAVSGEFPITNIDRSCGTMLSNEISKIYNDQWFTKTNAS